MKRSKNFLLLILLAVFSILMAGCQSASTPQPEPTTPPAIATPEEAQPMEATEETPSEPVQAVEKTFYIGPEKADCVGAGPMECYQIKEESNAEWQLFYDQIEGFEWEIGYTYEIRVAVHPVENSPADASAFRYELIEVVEKTAVTPDSKQPAQYIEIHAPADNDTIDTHKAVMVSGMGAGLFEGTVVVQASDTAGNELALVPTIIDSPEAGIGGEGPWQVELEIVVDAAIDGTIMAFAQSPADGSIMASDEVTVRFNPKMETTEIPLENTSWQLTSFGKPDLNPLLAVHQITALLNPAENTISGVAACNRYFGNYQLDGEKMSIPAPIATTKIACMEPEAKLESAYLETLQQIASYEIKCGNLTFFDARGETLLVFQEDPYSQTKSFTREQLANAAYLSEWTESGIVQLTNGEYRAPIVEGSASELVVQFTNYVAFGDLDGDGQEDAVVILVTNAGGSGSFYNLAVMRQQDEALTNLATTLLGDRVQIKSLRIENGEISVDFLTQGPDDAMCCPTQYTIIDYILQNGELVRSNSETVK